MLFIYGLKEKIYILRRPTFFVVKLTGRCKSLRDGLESSDSSSRFVKSCTERCTHTFNVNVGVALESTEG
ncbi:predicted protein [Sclerotinia sclerotiorum 1980 UF-70]|uniref:Uncharacterized protein n=1 Tax=Sclerotinia sclerotiorum (strain ATCC 18683 / 1980 / Ss-1) TaxID=665079 RepID=A7EN74_SCLS1|nr:predicted protein [Sclerotinia sclerotiorum 1980 UF-70]EDO04290.1 predicted protein [Sclerotinia sclerotiorum 1980 UF-70]